MKILLFNDNPVVRKLVALSAQKTKDELSVVWSVDEIEESEYDLLIIDDALYSDETFESLKEYIRYKSALLMATRGHAVPAGFDNVINKPFLPTDLVDMFTQIEKNLESMVPASAPEPEPASQPEPVEMEDALSEEEASFAINLEDELPEMESRTDSMFEDEEFGDDLELGELGSLEEETPLTSILDEVEVQEVRNLLDDTEIDEMLSDEAITVGNIDDFEMPEELLEAGDAEFDFGELETDAETASVPNDETETPETFNFDDILDSLKDELSDDDEAEEALDFSDEIGMEDEVPLAADSKAIEDDLPEAFDFDEASLAGMEEESAILAGFSDDDVMENDLMADLEEEEENDFHIDDSVLDDLASQIRDAVEELEPEDLGMEVESEDFEMELDEAMLNDLNLEESASAEGVFDELDMLDERELKLAIGEETEDDLDIRVGESGHTSLSVEALSEAMGKSAQMASNEEISVSVDKKSSGTEGVEAIQALLKALANEEVAKSLKGLNISININFGNDK